MVAAPNVTTLPSMTKLIESYVVIRVPRYDDVAMVHMHMQDIELMVDMR